ncbi:MAG: DUF2490 domain-containing protein [Flavobacteriales bacterium]
MVRILISLFLAFTVGISFGQSKLGNWQAYINNTRIGESQWHFQGDVQHRTHDLVADIDQIIIRPGIQYMHPESKSSYLLGYAFFIFQDEGKPNNTVTEHRIFQDIDLRQGIGRVAVRHRYRIEERFVNSNPFALRFRYSLFLNIPINKPKIEAKTLYVPIWNEVFINAKGAPFDRDWLFGGLGYQLTEDFALQFGAMNQFRTSGPKAQLILSMHHNIK